MRPVSYTHLDIINWDENAALLIQNALSPAKVISVIADGEEKTAKVVVPDYQLSLAIGKEGQNARLAARLTGFKIDIKSETQAREAGDFMDYETDYEDVDYDEYDDYDEDYDDYDDYDGEFYDETAYDEESDPEEVSDERAAGEEDTAESSGSAEDLYDDSEEEA